MKRSVAAAFAGLVLLAVVATAPEAVAMIGGAGVAGVLGGIPLWFACSLCLAGGIGIAFGGSAAIWTALLHPKGSIILAACVYSCKEALF